MGRLARRELPLWGHIYQSHAWGEFKRRLDWSPVRPVLERNGEEVGLWQFLARSTAPVPGVVM